MERTILVRIGEIFLKGNNRRYFENILKQNISENLQGIDCSIVYERNRIIIENFMPSNERRITDKLSKVFGIHSISPAMKTKTDIELIKKLCAEISPKNGIFRVTVNRADKSIIKRSMDIAAEIGAYMLSQSKELRVNLFEYDFEVYVDIRENGQTYIFTEKLSGAGGLPVGCSGKGMLLLSGGIDSPVAGYCMAKRGVKLCAVHYHSFPYTGELAKQKVIDLAKKLSAYCGNIQLYIAPFTDIQYAIREKCPAAYMITFMRRFMMRIAEKLALKTGCSALITGESLGQVASQTMESINVTNSVVKLPVFRPLIGYDKNEIIDIAKKIDTFDLSILPYEDCCTVFLPKNPIIKPDLIKVEEMEKALDSMEDLINKSIENVEIINTIDN
ncbi:MAG: tRNA uracil 4-sulfurtransferase ThiI [Christensenellales bacterium]|jgi:thiamine biosynthesis protein ThiI|nr:tRNA 4-thiouridine(8) synthase ThiI [Clostridiales bacterium]